MSHNFYFESLILKKKNHSNYTLEVPDFNCITYYLKKEPKDPPKINVCIKFDASYNLIQSMYKWKFNLHNLIWVFKKSPWAVFKYNLP